MATSISYDRLLAILGVVEYGKLLERINEYTAHRLVDRTKTKAEKAAILAASRGIDHVNSLEAKKARRERRLKALELRANGMIYRAIGEQFGVGTQMARVLVVQGARELLKGNEKHHPLYAFASTLHDTKWEKFHRRHGLKPYKDITSAST